MSLVRSPGPVAFAGSPYNWLEPEVEESQSTKSGTGRAS